jgi:predicted DNA-binding transcriptional regulator YafY
MVFNCHGKKVRHQFELLDLERIEKCQLGKETFRIAENFRSDLFFEHSIGITEKQEEPSEVVLAFDMVPGKYLLTQPIHASQRLLKEDKNEIQISLKVLLTPELFTFIMGYGSQVRVLKPTSLKKEITKRLKSALDQYE